MFLIECSTQNPSSTTLYDTQSTTVTTQSSPDPTESPVVTSDTPTTENIGHFTTTTITTSTITDVREGTCQLLINSYIL